MKDQVCRSCVMTLQGFDTRADLIMLGNLDFGTICNASHVGRYESA